MPDLVPDWFRDKRKMLEESKTMVIDSFGRNFTQSSHGPYKFGSLPFEFSKQHWFYSSFSISSKSHDKILEFVRDDAHFPYAWVKKHPKKRKYLLCAEDRQAISVIDLNSWKLHTWLDQDDDFCPLSFFPSRSGKFVAIMGSVFGELPKIRFYNFMDPIRFPWKMVGEFDGLFIHNNEKYYPSYCVGWDGEKYLRVICETDVDETHVSLTEFVLYPDGEYIYDCSEVVEKETID